MIQEARDKAWEELCRNHCGDFDDHGEQCADNIGLAGIFNAGYTACEVEMRKEIDGDTSDGYHTFNELYDHRRVLTKSLFNLDQKCCRKSRLHFDGTMFDNYFIVGIETNLGWATYHYHLDFWNDFECNEIDNFPEWDGHTASDSINRINYHFHNL